MDFREIWSHRCQGMVINTNYVSSLMYEPIFFAITCIWTVAKYSCLALLILKTVTSPWLRMCLWNFCSFHTNPFEGLGRYARLIERWQHHAAAVGVFLVWGELMLMIGRLPTFGIYVQMFTTVAKNFAKFLAAYFCLLVIIGGVFIRNLLVTHKKDCNQTPDRMAWNRWCSSHVSGRFRSELLRSLPQLLELQCQPSGGHRQNAGHDGRRNWIRKLRLWKRRRAIQYYRWD